MSASPPSLLKHCNCWRCAAAHGSPSPSVVFHRGASSRHASLSLSRLNRTGADGSTATALAEAAAGWLAALTGSLAGLDADLATIATGRLEPRSVAQLTI